MDPTADEWTAYAPTRPFTIHTLAPERTHTHGHAPGEVGNLLGDCRGLPHAPGRDAREEIRGVVRGQRLYSSKAANSTIGTGRWARFRQCITATTMLRSHTTHTFDAKEDGATHRSGRHDRRDVAQVVQDVVGHARVRHIRAAHGRATTASGVRESWSSRRVRRERARSQPTGQQSHSRLASCLPRTCTRRRTAGEPTT